MLKPMKYFFLLLLLSALSACSPEDSGKRLAYALEFAGANRGELERVLAHYEGDPLKREAARFLIENMPRWYAYGGWQLDTLEAVQVEMLRTDTLARKDRRRWQGFDYHSLPKVYDAQVIRADYLIENIDLAFREWRERPWNRTLPFDDFCELILPYRIGDEPLSDWRRLYRSYYGALLDSACHSGDVLEACRVVNDELARQGYKYNVELSVPHRRGTFLFSHRIGYCREVSDLTLYAMRSCGIPVATDFIVYSPDYQHSHEWNVVRDTTGCFIPFGFEWSRPERTEQRDDGRKKGKVYRHGYAFRPERLAWAERTGASVGGMDGCYWEDVTSGYFGQNRVEVPLEGGTEGPVWLAVFSPGGWRAVDTGVLEDGCAVFCNVEPDVIYVPVCRRDGTLHAAGYAFVRTEDGVCERLIPDTGRMERVTLGRKMPVLPRMKAWEYSQVGARLEGDNSLRFVRPRLMARLDDTVRYTYGEVRPQTSVPFRYVRYHAPQGRRIQLSELQLFADTAGREPIRMVAVDSLPPLHRMGDITDGNWLTEFYSRQDSSCFLTFRLETCRPVRLVRYTAKADDNYVWPGDEYELLYHDGAEGWKSLGRKRAEGKTVDFEAPHGALLWLRDRTKGREEQVFFWRDGRQWFTADL